MKSGLQLKLAFSAYLTFNIQKLYDLLINF